MRTACRPESSNAMLTDAKPLARLAALQKEVA